MLLWMTFKYIFVWFDFENLLPLEGTARSVEERVMGVGDGGHGVDFEIFVRSD